MSKLRAIPRASCLAVDGRLLCPHIRTISSTNKMGDGRFRPGYAWEALDVPISSTQHGATGKETGGNRHGLANVMVASFFTSHDYLLS
jgi:hypothetical protein